MKMQDKQTPPLCLPIDYMGKNKKKNKCSYLKEWDSYYFEQCESHIKVLENKFISTILFQSRSECNNI